MTQAQIRVREAERRVCSEPLEHAGNNIVFSVTVDAPVPEIGPILDSSIHNYEILHSQLDRDNNQYQVMSGTVQVVPGSFLDADYPPNVASVMLMEARTLIQATLLPTTRCVLGKNDSKKSVIVVDIHPAFVDRKSIRLLLPEFLLKLNQIPPQKQTEVSYSGFANFERQQEEKGGFNEGLREWGKVLKGQYAYEMKMHTKTAARTTNRRQQCIKTRAFTVDFSDTVMSGINEFISPNNKTKSTSNAAIVVLAVWKVVMNRWADNKQVITGCDVDNREQNPTWAQSIGNFSNLMPVRLDINETQSFSNHVTTLLDYFNKMDQWKYVPINLILDTLQKQAANQNSNNRGNSKEEEEEKGVEQQQQHHQEGENIPNTIAPLFQVAYLVEDKIESTKIRDITPIINMPILLANDHDITVILHPRTTVILTENSAENAVRRQQLRVSGGLEKGCGMTVTVAEDLFSAEDVDYLRKLLEKILQALFARKSGVDKPIGDLPNNVDSNDDDKGDDNGDGNGDGGADPALDDMKCKCLLPLSWFVAVLTLVGEIVFCFKIVGRTAVGHFLVQVAVLLCCLGVSWSK